MNRRDAAVRQANRSLEFLNEVDDVLIDPIRSDIRLKQRVRSLFDADDIDEESFSHIMREEGFGNFSEIIGESMWTSPDGNIYRGLTHEERVTIPPTHPLHETAANLYGVWGSIRGNERETLIRRLGYDPAETQNVVVHSCDYDDFAYELYYTVTVVTLIGEL